VTYRLPLLPVLEQKRQLHDDGDASRAELSMAPVEPERATPEALEAFLKAEIGKWGPDHQDGRNRPAIDTGVEEAAPVYAAGKAKENVAPPSGSFAARSSPPCSRTMP
jgi:hypothetical protein